MIALIWRVGQEKLDLYLNILNNRFHLLRELSTTTRTLCGLFYFNGNITFLKRTEK